MPPPTNTIDGTLRILRTLHGVILFAMFLYVYAAEVVIAHQAKELNNIFPLAFGCIKSRGDRGGSVFSNDEDSACLRNAAIKAGRRDSTAAVEIRRNIDGRAYGCGCALWIRATDLGSATQDGVAVLRCGDWPDAVVVAAEALAR